MIRIEILKKIVQKAKIINIITSIKDMFPISQIYDTFMPPVVSIFN